MEGEPRPQRVVALGPEPRMKPHDVAGLQCRAVEAPALRVEDVLALVGLACLAGVVSLIGHLLLWTMVAAIHRGVVGAGVLADVAARRPEGRC